MTKNDFLKLTEVDEANRLRDSNNLFHVLFKRNDFSMELFAPRGKDVQLPHIQDEVYVISSGLSKFQRGDEIVSPPAGPDRDDALAAFTLGLASECLWQSLALPARSMAQVGALCRECGMANIQ
jgi:hypothetical protein